MGITLLKLSAEHIYDAFMEGTEKYINAEDKSEHCNPDAPVLVMINGKRHHVLSVGGDPDEEGFVLEVKPASYWGE